LQGLIGTLLPECRDDFIDESNPVRVIDAFVDAIALAELGFDSVKRIDPGGRYPRVSHDVWITCPLRLELPVNASGKNISRSAVGIVAGVIDELVVDG
jgi:hypothetical protein